MRTICSDKRDHFKFSIERHGTTSLGSTRAAVHKWRLDLLDLTASVSAQSHRQLSPMDKKLDVRPIAEKLAKAISEGKTDQHMTITCEGRVRLDIAEIIPETNKQTTAGRRKRLRQELNARLEPLGWKPLRPNVYEKIK